MSGSRSGGAPVVAGARCAGAQPYLGARSQGSVRLRRHDDLWGVPQGTGGRSVFPGRFVLIARSAALRASQRMRTGTTPCTGTASRQVVPGGMPGRRQDDENRPSSMTYPSMRGHDPVGCARGERFRLRGRAAMTSAAADNNADGRRIHPGERQPLPPV